MRILTEPEAKERLDRFLDQRRRDYPTDPEWLEDLELRQVSDGEWLALRPGAEHPNDEVPTEGVRVTESYCALFLGALGKLVGLLGYPKTCEQHLGSTWLGRYQEYERGIGVWEVLASDSPSAPPWDSARPSFLGESLERFRSASALVAFFDLRGFTKWSESQETPPARIQEVVTALERAFQAAFPIDEKVFVKGTGDGLMVVLETGPHVTRGPAIMFCKYCAKTIRLARQALDSMGLRQLAVGCGVTFGPVNRVYVLGRFDYIGEPVNRASKLQAFTFDELCIAQEVATVMQQKPEELGHRIAGNHWRVSVNKVEGLQLGTVWRRVVD